MRSENDYTDTAVAMGLGSVQFSTQFPANVNWQYAAADTYCGGDGRIDTYCMDPATQNTCNRIFTDYGGGTGCYPALGDRCFNDGRSSSRVAALRSVAIPIATRWPTRLEERLSLSRVAALRPVAIPTAAR